ncbi:uncharacterized protein LOC143353744 isoform X3 [Halictus rubicundus]|uniref:uncharacterized protein LOC143353744 isoform X3 n=1 Tax=Halictus rubicundus TaxID=77578 RepID=UPI0040359338
MGGPPSVMAGKDGKLEPKSGDVVRQGFMVKRSQNKKRFTPVNYKQRWFILTRRYLVYYDSDGERRKERGRIAVESVHVVETASLGSNAGGVGGVGSEVAGSEAGTGGVGGGGGIGGGGGRPPGLPFQVGYREAGQEYTLYLLAAREQDRAEWIRAIRAVCSENPGLSGRYHAGLWTGKRWSCCRLSTRSAEGCDTCSSWSSKPLNPTNPSSTSTSSLNPAAGTTSTTTAAITDRPQTTNSEANNNPIVHSQARSTIGCPNNVVTGPKGYCVNNFNRAGYVVRPGMGAHKLFKHEVTWNKAREICMQEGGQLPVIDSAEKEAIFRKWMTNEMVDDVWLGIHDRFVEGTWVTLTGESLDGKSYYPWAGGEPNDANGGEDCGVLSKIPRNGINDFSCFGRFSYICEISLCDDL